MKRGKVRFGYGTRAYLMVGPFYFAFTVKYHENKRYEYVVIIDPFHWGLEMWW